MQENNIKTTEKLLEDISHYSWFKAIFKWWYIKKQILNIKYQYNQLVKDFLVTKEQFEFKNKTLQDTLHNLELQKNEILHIKNKLNELEKEKNNIFNKLENISTKNTQLEKQLSSKQKEIDNIKEEIDNIKIEKKTLDNKYQDISTKNTQLEKQLSSKQKEIDNIKENYEEKLQNTYETQKRYENKLLKIEKKEEQKIEEKYKQMELTWNEHEENVAMKLKEICWRLWISNIGPSEYEYKWRPDNVIVVANEYVIFDAKSPKKAEELSNFQHYLKDQSEKAKKYAKHKKVKKDIYLVVPENALTDLTITYYEEWSYRVHIISINSLETILRSLQKIDDYENLKDMDPEEREAIFNFIWKMLHAAKRRIQIDALYGIHVESIIKEAISIYSEDTREQIEYYEKTSKWNPWRDEKKKRISNSSLDKSVKDLQKTAFSQELNIEKNEYKKIEKIPLLNDFK